jgi:hypothetical protein
MAIINVELIIQAVQWTGTNVTEIRQIVRAGLGAFNDAIIRNGTLYIFNTATGTDPVEGIPPPMIPVPVGSWLVTGDPFNPLTDAQFTARFRIVP